MIMIMIMMMLIQTLTIMGTSVLGKPERATNASGPVMYWL